MVTVMDVFRTRARLGWRAFVVGTGLALLVTPAAARAEPRPVITRPPVITGTPQVGLELVAYAEYYGDPRPIATYAWQRCAKGNGNGGCTAIAGATNQRYVVAAADAGTFLRVRIKVTNPAGSATAQSRPTTVVLGAPALTPTPSPGPVATAPPPPAAAPVPPAAAPVPPAAAPVPAPASAPVPAAPAPLVPLVLDPFPVVRIRGELTAKGARVTLLSVRAPGDVRIDVTCTGADCPARR